MAGVSSKFQRQVAGEEATCPADRAPLVFTFHHIVELMLQNLENKDLRRARMINKVSNEVARKLLEKRILSNWITFPLYGCQPSPHLAGIPVLKATVPHQTVTPGPFTLRAYLPVGMQAAKAAVPARSLQIFGKLYGNWKNTWEKSCNYKKQTEPVFNILSSLGGNLTSLRLDNVMLFPSTLVELLRSTPNLKALSLSCLRLRNEKDPDFEMTLALPPLAHLSSLKLGENSGTNHQLNFWLVKDYAGQLADLELDAGRFGWQHVDWNNMVSPCLIFGKLQRLRVYQLSSALIFMVKAPTLTFLSMEMYHNNESINLIHAIMFPNLIWARSLLTLQLNIPWDFAPIFNLFSNWESIEVPEFQCLTKIAVTDPHSYQNPDRRAVEACKLLVSKSTGLKELHLLHAVSLGTETAQEYLNRVRSLAQSERYCDSSQTLEKIWIELELRQSHDSGVTVPPMGFIQLLVWDRDWETLDLRNQQ